MRSSERRRRRFVMVASSWSLLPLSLFTIRQANADAPVRPGPPSIPERGGNGAEAAPRALPEEADPATGGDGAPPAAPAPAAGEATATATSAGLGTIVVTGTRRLARTVFDSNVPVDVVTAADLKAAPSPDLNDKLAQTVPSYNVQRMPLADGAIFNRPATLRGLSPDQVLVLVNGKRRHRSAFIDVTAQGAQAVDLGEIPASAIERIEVLRDGASAQYGSDAIAGVINVILKSKPGVDGYLQYSRYYAGDGTGYVGGFNLGQALGEHGTVSLSLEGRLGEATSRSNQRPNAAALAAAGNTAIQQPAVVRFGQPDTRAFLSFLNAKYELSTSAELYLFGSFGYHWGENDFNYRSPTQGGVFTSTQPADVLGRTLPTVGDPYRDWFNNNPARLSGYPGGFTPRFSGTSLDGSAVAGIRGEVTRGLSYDLSGRFGQNHVRYRVRNTLNASEGPFSPKAFDTGARKQTELGANLDLNYLLPAGLSSPINIAFGGEVRREEYRIIAGEPDSYAIGELGKIGLAGGANSFFGTAPNQAGTWGRNSVAGYIDTEADLFPIWNVGLAGRAESYADAGSTVNGKVSTRIAILDIVNLRGALSTGFRAPTPGQQNLTNTNQNPSPDGLSIQTNGTIPSTNPIAVLKGGVPLKPEKSVNISFGFVARPLKRLTFSADAYQIDIRDRIGLSQRNTLTDEEQAGLLASGVAAAEGLTSFNFFVNGYKTRTRGLDLVLAYEIDLTAKSHLNFTTAANFNKTEIVSFQAGVIDARQRQYLEDRLPKQTSNIAVEYGLDKISLTARARQYGPWTEPLDPTTDANGRLIFNQRFGAEVFFDLIASYAFTPHSRLVLGVENLLNDYPDKAKFPNTVEGAAAGAVPTNGRVYPSQRPYESDGGRYYARLDVNF